MTDPHTGWGIDTSVGLTALGVAAARAIETSRDESLVHDPWAAEFVASADGPTSMPTTAQEASAAAGRWHAMADWVGVRSRFFDSFLQTARRSGIDQVVLLAAGLDTRAYRTGWQSGCVVYEVDQPRLLEFKGRVLRAHNATPACDRRAVGADLRGPWLDDLRAAGHDQDRPTAWLAEGVLPYLPAAAVGALFEQVRRASPPGSLIATEDITDVPAMTSDLSLVTTEFTSEQFGVDVTQLVNHEPRTRADEHLKRHGWVIVRNESHTEAAMRFGRPMDTDLGRIIDEYGVLTSAVL